MDNFFDLLFSNADCIAALQNSTDLETLVVNLKPHFPEISADKVREYFDIPSDIQDDFCLDYIFTLLEKMEILAKEDDRFLSSVSGGMFGPMGGLGGSGAGYSAMAGAMTTQAYIGLGTSVLSGGMSITSTMLGGREARKTQSEGFAQQKELITMQTDAQIKIIQAQRG